MHKWLSVCLLLFVGCSDCSTDEKEVPAKQVYAWPVFPVRMELSARLTTCQRAGVLAGVTYWESLTHQRLIQAYDVPADALSVNGLVPKGVIAVTNEPMYNPSTLDQVEWIPLSTTTVKSRYLHSVEMRIQGCSLRAFAHEVGHALGMGHSQGINLLMTQEHHPDAWLVTDTELKAVVQPSAL